MTKTFEEHFQQILNQGPPPDEATKEMWYRLFFTGVACAVIRIRDAGGLPPKDGLAALKKIDSEMDALSERVKTDMTKHRSFLESN